MSEDLWGEQLGKEWTYDAFVDNKYSHSVFEVEGHLNPNEAALLEELASQVTEGVIVEIGSFRGKSTIRLAIGAKKHKRDVYAIDPHDLYNDNGTWFGKEDRAVFVRNLVNAGVADTVKPVYLKSHHAAQGWTEPIGLLFVDGDHTYDAVKQDIADWLPHVIDGGVIAFHDSWFEDVSRAITELLADTRYQLVGRADATAVIQFKDTKAAITKRPDVSVLIPAYNASETIERAILSVLKQEGVSVEIIVCDDASTDDTGRIVTDMMVGDNNVEYVKAIKNAGIASSLNAAADNAIGRYFIELDSDDWLAHNCLAPMVKALDEHPEVGFVYGKTEYSGDANFVHTPPEWQPRQLWGGFTPLYAFMYRREAWDDGCRYRTLLEKEGRLIGVQDYDFALQLSEHMRWRGMALRDLMVLHYNYHEGTLTSLLKKYNFECVTAFKTRWPMLYIGQL